MQIAPQQRMTQRAEHGRTATLLSILQKPHTQIQQRALLVLLVTLPVWIYVTTWDALMMQFLNAAYGQTVAVSDLPQMLLNNFLILPLLFLAYFVALGLPVREQSRTRLIGKEILLGLAFSALARPAKITAHYLTDARYASSRHGSAEFLKAYYFYWQDWIAVTIQYSIAYLLGLMILWGINAFLRYKFEQLRSEQLHSRWLEARLSLLRQQLDPHFLFNAINVVVSFIRSDPIRAEKLLIELAQLLRLSLAGGSHKFTTLQREMQFIERYLSIMRVRFENRLDVNLTIDPASLQCRIPGFLLVPLVENAIKHGVENQPGRNLLEICSRVVDANLSLVVKNSFPATGVVGDTFRDGTGLNNTRERLLAIYGDQFRLESGWVSGGHWSTSVTIPAEADDEIESAAATRVAIPADSGVAIARRVV